MKTVYICFSRRRGFAIGSELIQKFMGKPFSHTYFKFKEDRYVDHTIFHAVGKGLIYVSEATLLEHNVPAKEFALVISDELFDELMQDCHKNAGKDYGFLQNLGVALVCGLAKLKIKVNKNPINDGINCSEWMYYILEEIYGKWTDEDPNLIGPDQIYDFLESKGVSNA